MDNLINSYNKSKNLHHAYFLVGDSDSLFKELVLFLENFVGVQTSGNPDFWIGKFDNLTIDDARFIRESSERKDFSGNKKIFVIQTDFISQEAQNSLLKVFEEPTEGTHFFIISPQDVILPTLRSRMQVVLSENLAYQKNPSILGLSLKERLSKVKEITDGISDEENTKQDAISLLNQIELELYKKGVEKNIIGLKICDLARASLYDRGALIKMILENVMINI
ncbi:MAG: DNA polymerase III delta prime subunit [Parcubacteria bacterium C7867-006]|nr:MAG: DNA polymerase III delta prime subunit [Parcubacteria bacterium C7867-006]